MTSDATIVNKRGHDPDDSERLAHRRSIRLAAAKRDLELAPARLAEADIAASELRVDAAADEHSTACAPLQEELAALEQAAIGRVADRLPANAEEDARRAELIGEIGVLTTTLEAAVAAERKIQSSLLAKVQYIRQGHLPPDTILAALSRPPLANPRLLAELFVSRERIKWLRARAKAAEKALDRLRFSVGEIKAGRMAENLGFFLGKVYEWELEGGAVAKEIAAATSEGQRVHSEILDE
ncbi:MAG TPA: hypothetical protein VMY37_18890 [Thermoguttaceae bacterium]|nr:hypothetical protein [Thermoguttaceae bacterium]